MQNKNPQGNFDPIPDSDQELEKYGVWVKAEPQDLVEEPETEHQPLVAEAGSSLEPLEELSDEVEELEEMQSLDEAGSETPDSIDFSDFGLDEPEGKTEDEQSFEEISMDLDLDDDLSADGASDDEMDFDFGPSGEPAAGMDLSFDSEGSGELLPEIEMENIDIEDESTAPAFDDLGALEKDLASSSSTDNSVPNDLLQKIALELSSIKEELVSLRSQLGELKREPVSAGLDEEEKEDEGAKGGFFDDEDDDTIALTGDELDNILNTADFTVEPPEDLTIPESLDEIDFLGTSGILEESGTTDAEWNAEAKDLLPEDGSYLTGGARESGQPGKALEPGIETIEGDEALDLDFGTDDELSPLDIIPEIQVVTESPEDTSYLDEEATELSDGFELDASPLEEVPLVEPDLTEMDLGIEIDDAIAAESREDLPFMESADDEGELILDDGSEAVSLEAAPEADQSAIEDDDFDSILDLEEADDELILSIDGEEQAVSSEAGDFSGSIEEIEDAEPLSMDPFQDEMVSELELHKEGSAQADGSWAHEPETKPQGIQTEEFGELESLAEDEALDQGNKGSTFELESMDFEDSGLLESQVVEDLGGEELEELEDLGVEELETLESEELEVRDSELLEGLGDADEPGSLDDFEEIEELSESDELESGSMIAESGQADEELQSEKPRATPATGRSAVPEETGEHESGETVPDKLKQDVKSVLLYLDQLLASLPEEKIEEFASSEYYDTYKKLFEDLGLL
jgi:pilus assembly protein FimV